MMMMMMMTTVCDFFLRCRWNVLLCCIQRISRDRTKNHILLQKRQGKWHLSIKHLPWLYIEQFVRGERNKIFQVSVNGLLCEGGLNRKFYPIRAVLLYCSLFSKWSFQLKYVYWFLTVWVKGFKQQFHVVLFTSCTWWFWCPLKRWFKIRFFFAG